MKSALTASLFLCGTTTLVSACMSDHACSGGDVSMCCYMNRCVPSSNIGCTADRLKFYRHLHSLDEDCKMKSFAEEIRESSERVRKCDEQGINCIDYVTELMSDPGAFDGLDGASDFIVV